MMSIINTFIYPNLLHLYVNKNNPSSNKLSSKVNSEYLVVYQRTENSFYGRVAEA